MRLIGQLAFGLIMLLISPVALLAFILILIEREEEL